MRVELRWDAHEFDDLLAAWKEPAVKRTLQAAASAYGRTVKPIIQAATPISRPGTPARYGLSAGNLQRATRYKRMRARYGIGVVVGPMGKNAYYRGMVTGGTKPHIILPKAPGSRGQAARALAIAGGFATVVHHPGARANPYVARAGRAATPLGMQAAELVIFQGLDAKRVIETTD